MIDIDKFKNNLNNLKLKLIYDLDLKNIKSNDKLDLIDYDGFKYSLTPNNIKCTLRRNGKLGTYFNGNPYTIDNIQLFLNKNNNNIKLITDKINNAKQKVMWYCSIHNVKFKKSWNEIKNGSNCQLCGREKYLNSKKHTIEYIKETALNKYGIKILENHYINNETKMAFICNKHKKEGVQYKTWGNIISKKSACVYCSKESYINKITKSHSKFKDEFYNIHGYDRYTILSEYKTCKIKIKIKCNICGNIFNSSPSHLLEGHGCPFCVKSKGENRVENILKQNNIKYIREYMFDDCLGRTLKRKIPFDFYLEEYNLCIEYQGKQHYEPVELFGGGDSFKKQIENDNIKRAYCKNNNINLLEICYKDFDNIEHILLNKLNQLRYGVMNYYG